MSRKIIAVVQTYTIYVIILYIRNFMYSITAQHTETLHISTNNGCICLPETWSLVMMKKEVRGGTNARRLRMRKNPVYTYRTELC